MDEQENLALPEYLHSTGNVESFSLTQLPPPKKHHYAFARRTNESISLE